MFSCDLCKNSVDGIALVAISAKHMQRAVRDGFNPFESSDICMPESPTAAEDVVVADEPQLEQWRKRAMSTTIDWRLCPNCLGAVFRATASAEESKAPPKEGQLKAFFKTAKLFLSPAGASIALICFFLPWVRVSCAGDLGKEGVLATYSASDSQLGGILWIAFLAAIVVVLAFSFFLAQKKVERARLIVAISALIGLVAIILRYFQAINDTYDFYGLLLKYDDVKGLIRVNILYGAWGTWAGLIIAFVSWPLLKSKDRDNAARGRPPPKGKPENAKKKKPAFWDYRPP